MSVRMRLMTKRWAAGTALAIAVRAAVGVVGGTAAGALGASPAPGETREAMAGAHATVAGSSVPPSQGVPEPRLAALKLGVNLNDWLCYTWEPDALKRLARVSEADLRQLRSAGVTHVRLPLDPDKLWDHEGGVIREQALSEAKAAIARVVGSGLLVIIDAHVWRGDWWKPDATTRRAVKYEAFWDALARELARDDAARDPERVMLEIMNEPHGIEPADESAAIWAAAQEALVGVVRRHCPTHTIVATGADWGGIDGLLKLEPLRDRNVVYSFHFYDPMNFTHQGADWGFHAWKDTREVPYPVGPEEVEAISHKQGSDAARDSLRWMFRQRWDKARIAERIGQAAAWSRKHGVPVYCGEMGVYSKVAPAADRIRWHRDVAEALRENNIGFACWGYADAFGFASGEAGARTLDPGMAAALGLRVP
ncbi:MAG: cellulase family glycosylhydrolase [Planctomycetota bacterium]|nr:cellulase family glycosylhydrolase [Planctomycetota bacterium]